MSIAALWRELPQGEALPKESWCRRHRGILAVLWAHALAIPTYGLLTGGGLALSLGAGVSIASIAAIGNLAWLNRHARSAITTFGLMTAAAWLVHLSGGYIESHFHFFVLMAVVALYQDWVPFLVALVAIVVDHGLMGMVEPHMVYNHPAAQQHPWQWALIHGGFILGESAALLLYWRANEGVSAQLRDSEERTRSIVDSAMDAVVVIDEDGRITEWNRQAETMFGWARAEVRGLPLSETVVSPQYREAHERGLRRYLQTGQGSVIRQRIELSALRRDGSEFPIELAITPLRLQTGMTFSAFIRDITERRQAQQELVRSKEAAEAANHAKSLFLANMSHEVRTPMNGVLGMTELLLASSLDARQRHLAENIQRSGTNLLHVINDILDFSKVEAGKLTLERVPFDLCGLVEEAVEFMAEPARRKGLTLTCHVNDTIRQRVGGDPTRLRQILSNLLGNAVKFTERGAITVTAEPTVESPGAITVRFAVRDSGVGIPTAAQRRVFDAFSQADGTTTRRFGGTGLGLAIVKQLVELMGGTVGLDSTEGQGSTFWFTAVFDSPPPDNGGPDLVENRRTAGATVSEKGAIPPRVLHILLVEDTAVNQEVAVGMLELMGHRVDLAENGWQALEATARTSYDLVFMDCQMPGLDGFEATRRMRQREGREPAAGRLPIIALTAHAMSSDREGCLAAGMDGYLSKPFTFQQLHDALARWAGPVPPHTLIAQEAVMNAGSDETDTRSDAMKDGATPATTSVEREALDRLRALDRPGRPSVFAKVVAQFLQSAQETVESLREALRRDDAAALYAAAHRLKSSSAQLGALTLSEQCQELESMGRSQSVADADAALRRLETEFFRVAEALRSELAVAEGKDI